MTRITDPEGAEAAALDRLVDFGGKDVIDLGCGDGRTTWHIACTAASVIGVDPDAQRIDLARSRARGRGIACRFLVADAVSLELPDGTFDIAVFSRSL